MRCRCNAEGGTGVKGRCDPSSRRELAPSRLIHSHSLTLTTSRHTATHTVWNAVLLLPPSIQFNLTRPSGSRQVINDPSPSLSQPAIVYSLPGCGNRSPFAARLIPVTHLASPLHTVDQNTDTHTRTRVCSAFAWHLAPHLPQVLGTIPPRTCTLLFFSLPLTSPFFAIIRWWPPAVARHCLSHLLRLRTADSIASQVFRTSTPLTLGFLIGHSRRIKACLRPHFPRAPLSVHHW